MKADVVTIEAGSAGSVDLDEGIFGLKPRADLLQRAVRWQLANRQSGTHKAQGRSEVTGSMRKIVNQKGSGGARHGNRKAPQFRGGGKAFGPVVRSHGHDLPKKVRKLALKTALSTKQAEGKLIVLDEAKMASSKTRALADNLAKLGLSNALIIDGVEVDDNFARAAANIPNIDVLPFMGANVYDILRRDILVLTKSGLERLEERLK